MKQILALAFGALALVGFPHPVSADYRVLAAVPLDGLAEIPRPDTLPNPIPRMAVDPVAHRVYVSDGVKKTFVVDGVTDTLAATWPVGGIVAVNSHTGRVYLAGKTTVKVLDGANGAVLTTFPLSAPPSAIALDEGQNRLYVIGYVPCPDGGCEKAVLSAYDGGDGRLLSTLALDDLHPAMAVNSATHQVYVNGVSHVPVIEGDPLRLTDTLALSPGYSASLGVDPDGGEVYALTKTTTGAALGSMDTKTRQYQPILQTNPIPLLPHTFIYGEEGLTELSVGRDLLVEAVTVYVAPPSFMGFANIKLQNQVAFLKPGGSVVGGIKGFGAIAAVGEDPGLGRWYVLNTTTNRLTVLGDASAVDVTPPTVTMTADPPLTDQGWVPGGTALTLHAEDDPDGTGVQAVSCVSVDPSGERRDGIVYGGKDLTFDLYWDRYMQTPELTCLAWDEAGNETRIVRKIRFDFTQPTTKYTPINLPDGGREAELSAEDRDYNNSYPAMYFPASGVAETRYRLDGGEFRTYTGPIPIPADQLHTIEYYSTDVAGNVEGTHTLLLPINGDVNADGKMDVTDVILTLESVVGLVTLDPGPSLAADLNGDGNIDVGDAVLILRKIVGLP